MAIDMPQDEFDVIRILFAPLAKSASARGLLDDVAILEAKGRLVATTDAIVEGVHFLSSDPIETVAAKALRVNVSDLVGKGARACAALLTLVWPRHRPASEITAFADALGRDLSHFGIELIGGDTTSTEGPLVVSMTLFGEPLGARTPSRADAAHGEDVWLVGGDIGSAWLGLQLRSGAMGLDEIRRGREETTARMESDIAAPRMPDYLTLPGEVFDAEAAWLMSLYLAPFVRLEAAVIVSRFARASMDVSDGLVGDALKLASASGVAIVIDANAIPLSFAAERWVQSGGDIRKLITGGDDYVVLFTASAADREAILAMDSDHTLRLSRIGRVEAGAGVIVLDAAGGAMSIVETSYAHKLGT